MTIIHFQHLHPFTFGWTITHEAGGAARESEATSGRCNLSVAKFLFEVAFTSLNSTSNTKALRDQLTIDLEDKGLILGNTKASLELQIYSAWSLE